MFFQYNYTRENDLNLVSDGGDFLQLSSSMEENEQGIVSGLHDQYKQRR